MKLGVSFGHGLTPSQIVESSSKCENRYDLISISESTGVDALCLLAAVASRTSKLEIASGIVNVYSRSAVQLAMASATIQNVSRGKFTLGIGASSKSVISSWHNVEFRNQLVKVRSALSVLRMKLQNGTGEGGLDFMLQGSKVPLLVAAVGEKMLRIGLEEADGVIFFMRPLSKIREEVKKFQLLEKKIYANVVSCVSSDSKKAERRVRNTIAFYLTYGDSYRRLIQETENSWFNDIELVRHEWLVGKREEAARLIPEELVRELSIFGTVSECRKAIDEYHTVDGLTALSLQFNAGEQTFDDSISQLIRIPESK